MSLKNTSSNLIVPVASVVRKSVKDTQEREVLYFPSDLGAHSLIMNFKEYTFDRDDRVQNSITKGSIALPIPSNIKDSFAINVSGEELGLIPGAVSSATQTSNEDMTQFSKDVGESAAKSFKTFSQGNIGSILQSLRGGMAGMTMLALKAGASVISPDFAKGLEISDGLALNPHNALVFDGVSLKEHSFSWKLYPADENESLMVNRIINKIRKHITPKYSNTLGQETQGNTFLSRLFLKYPDVVDLFFTGTENDYLFYFKRCMVSGFEVNYAAEEGHPVFFKNTGRPAFIEISITLKEMSIHTRNDYEKLIDTAGGFENG